MGQYHRAVSFGDDGSTATIDHYTFGAGAKLGEQSYTWQQPGDTSRTAMASPYSSALGLMLLGPWHGRRLVVIGDYTEPADDAACGYSGPGHLADHYDPNGHRDDSAVALNLLGEAVGYRGGTDALDGLTPPADLVRRAADAPRHGDMVITSSCGEQIHPEAFASPANPLGSVLLGGVWSIVNVLCAVADGRGGGDFGLDPAGRWAYTDIDLVAAAAVDHHDDITHWLTTTLTARRAHRRGLLATTAVS